MLLATLKLARQLLKTLITQFESEVAVLNHNREKELPPLSIAQLMDLKNVKAINEVRQNLLGAKKGMRRTLRKENQKIPANNRRKPKGKNTGAKKKKNELPTPPPLNLSQTG